jgi:hypothetical protein
MLRSLAALMVALLAVVAAPAAAGASDASATETYLRANYALVSVAHSHLGSSIAAYKGVLHQVRSQCPKAAAKSPQNSESTQLSNEVIGAMVIAAGKPDRGAIATFMRTVSGLRWSSGSVTHAVSSYVSMLRKLYGLSAPDLCGDVRRWVASGFTSLPSNTVSFVKVFYPNWVALGLVPAGLGRFESSAGRSLAKRAGSFEYQLTNAEAEAVETWGTVMDTLELNP